MAGLTAVVAGLVAHGPSSVAGTVAGGLGGTVTSLMAGLAT